LADQYLKDGEKEKALQIYLEWYEKTRRYNPQVYDNVLDIYIQTGKYEEALEWVQMMLRKHYSPVFTVDEMHIYKLKKDERRAKKLSDKIKLRVKNKEYSALTVAYRLKKYNYLNEALAVLETAISQQPSANLYMQAGNIYAEKGNAEKMMEAYINTLIENEMYYHYITARLARYVTDEPENPYNLVLKTKLIEKIGENPLPVLLKTLQWLYVREKNFAKAFVQLRALVMQKAAPPSDLVYLARSAFEAGQNAEAYRILNYLSGIPGLTENLKDEMALLRTRIENKTVNEHDAVIEKWKKRAVRTSGKKIKTGIYKIIIDRLMYGKKDYASASRLIDSLSAGETNPATLSMWRERKADLLLLQKEFAAAAIEYTLLREDFPYEEINYRALYKIALASFFSGDFDWAHTTLKTLKKAADKKIANDALWLDFVIIANKEPRDTINEGLKQFASVYFDYYSKNYEDALRKLDTVKPDFKGQKIYDDLLYLEAKILSEKGEDEKTEKIWQEILRLTTDKIYREEACYRLGIIYAVYKNDEAQAKSYFKKVLTDFPQGFWFEPAQKYYRKLKENRLP
jgi:pentatricopeptide repeat protein